MHIEEGEGSERSSSGVTVGLVAPELEGAVSLVVEVVVGDDSGCVVNEQS